jgi:hypothetical protein
LPLPDSPTNPKVSPFEIKAKIVVELESRSTDLFALCLPNTAPCGLDMTTGIISV